MDRPILKIGRFSECDREYSQALGLQDTRTKLRKFTESYRRVADDAFQIVSGMSLGDFRQFRAGLMKERRGRFAGAEFAKRFGSVMMPAVLFEVSIVATHFGAPWGVAFERLIEVGLIVETDWVARMVKKAAD